MLESAYTGCLLVPGWLGRRVKLKPHPLENDDTSERLPPSLASFEQIGAQATALGNH